MFLTLLRASATPPRTLMSSSRLRSPDEPLRFRPRRCGYPHEAIAPYSGFITRKVIIVNQCYFFHFSFGNENFYENDIVRITMSRGLNWYINQEDYQTFPDGCEAF
jgi:hypothetical protein